MKRMGFSLFVLVVVLLLVITSWAGNATAAVTDLPWRLILADRPTRAWASVTFLTDRTLFATTDRALLKTADDGETWTTLYPRPPLTETLGISAFAADVGNQTLFLARNVPGGPAELYRSSDAGLTWSTVFSDTETIWQDVTAVRNSDNQLIVLAIGGQHVWRSMDGGASWETAVTGLPEFADLYRIYPSPDFVHDEILYLTEFGPLIRSTNGGDSWEVIHIPDVDIPRHVVFSPDYAADRTLWFSYFFVEGSGESSPNGVARSTDGGTTWEIVNEGLPVDYLDGWIMGLAASSGSGLYAVERVLNAGGTRWELYHSPNGGDSWFWQGVAPEATPGGLLAPVPGLFFLPTQNGLWRLRSSCTQWVVNGDMEKNEGWVMPATPATAAYATDQAQTGYRSIRIGIVDGPNRYAYSSAYQDVTLPAGAITTTLTLWLYPVATDTTDSDRQYIRIMDEDQNTLETLLWTLDNSPVWQPHTFDLTDYNGQNIRLYFGVYNNGADGTAGMYLDTVSLTTCAPPGPGPLTEHLFLPAIIGN